jgi:hypothetical protein
MEVIIPSRYILTKEEEIACFPAIAYPLPNGQVKHDVFYDNNPFHSVQMVGHAEQGILFTVCHVFVERYIQRYVKRAFDDVEIFRYYFSRGTYPEPPGDLQGEQLGRVSDAKSHDLWSSYEHISGPYIANPQLLTSAFSAGRLDNISPKATENLIPERGHYRRNPQDLPVVGVILADAKSGEVVTDQKYLEDLLIRTKSKKPTFIN